MESKVTAMLLPPGDDVDANADAHASTGKEKKEVGTLFLLPPSIYEASHKKIRAPPNQDGHIDA